MWFTLGGVMVYYSRYWSLIDVHQCQRRSSRGWFFVCYFIVGVRVLGFGVGATVLRGVECYLICGHRGGLGGRKATLIRIRTCLGRHGTCFGAGMCLGPRR